MTRPLSAATAAIRYGSSAFQANRERLTGLYSANAGFLNAYVASLAADDPVWLYVRSAEDATDFAERYAAGHPVKAALLPDVAQLAQPGCLYLAAPVVGTAAWHRRFVGARGYSLCGVTHTISTARVMDAVTDLLIAPVQSWDALVCTSSAVRRVVQGVLDSTTDYLAQRVGARPPMPVQLPVIPLGADTAAYAPADAEARRNAFRTAHGIGDDDVALLFFGRLSAHSKAHPNAMFRAAEAAARRTGKRLVLILAGWYHSDQQRDAFRGAAAALMPSVRLVAVDGREADVKAAVWHAADVFVSLTDNIQESFGLTPVEAMAAGLPCVVSDWDGYRDTVEDGVSGMLIPTLLPPAGAGEEVALRFALDADDYETYLARVCQSVVVDVAAAADAIATLALQAETRRRMGEAARRRARMLFDWQVVITQYRALWHDLAARRAVDAERAGRGADAPAWPAREDPFALFAPFASRSLGPDARIAAAVGAPVAALAEATRTPLDVIDPALLPVADAAVRQIASAGRPLSLADIVDRRSAARNHLMLRALGWLAKLGIVKA
ncbi:MAG TPA: glycosyltransferase family 4 protein [Azospirillum sp.]|nr:glycosyltransferase family 4 protein [Azospirillum sp.]